MSYEYLLEINKQICKEESGIRLKGTNIFKLIDKEVFKTMKNKFNEEQFLKNAMHIAALIKLYQPFLDGNNRTALIFFGDLITQNGYMFDYDQAYKDMENKKLTIPTIYDVSDKIGSIDNWYKYIAKEAQKKIS